MKVAIIGAGRQGGRRAKAVKECGDEIVTIVDTNITAAEALAKTYGGKASSDWKAAVDDKNTEAVIICTPNDTHADITIAAIRVGKHVLCEKPLVRTSEEISRVSDALKGSKSVLKCGFNYRHHPAIIQAKKRLDSGAMGKPILMRCRHGITGRDDYMEDWRMNASVSGGGELLDQGTHVLDLFRWFGGDISDLIGSSDTLYWNIKPLEDNAFAILHGKAGLTCMMHVSLTEWRNIFSFEVFGDKGYAKVEGLGGSYGTEKLILGNKDLSGKPFVEEVIEFKGGDISWVEEWKEFISAIKEKRVPLGSAEDGFSAVNLVLAIYESSKKGSVVKL